MENAEPGQCLNARNQTQCFISEAATNATEHHTKTGSAETSVCPAVEQEANLAAALVAEREVGR